MPTRLHLKQDDLEAVVEIQGREIVFVGLSELLHVVPQPDGRFAVTGGPSAVTGTAAINGDVAWVGIDGDVFEIHVSASRQRRADPDAGTLSPPMPATVVRVAVVPGQRVVRGDVLIALEAMKMELSVRAPRDGVVRAVHCREGELVQPGTRLLEID